jgi:hypothetical protein
MIMTDGSASSTASPYPAKAIADSRATGEEAAQAGPARSNNRSRPSIVLVIPRGEAVRNFLFSDTLKVLNEHARVTVLTVVADDDLVKRIGAYADEIIPIEEYPVPAAAAYLRTLTENAHDRWLWSQVAQNNWELRDRRARTEGKRLERMFIKVASRLLGNNPCLHALTSLEQSLQWHFRATRIYDELFARLKPDLVFNGSHIHGLAGELPLRVAQRMGIPTAGFIFSWDNLTSRSRIFVPYDYYLVWHDFMKRQLLGMYPKVREEQVFVTGTPQFDFHLKPEFLISREELCRRIGLDPRRPFILYTTGIWNHFFDEHLHVELVIKLLQESKLDPKPQLVVRNYAKGTGEGLKAMAARTIPDVIFPPVLWNEKSLMPLYEDLFIYTSLVEHAAMSINAASTVTLEFMIKDKPVINLDFDPPGTNLPPCLGYSRHLQFDHFLPVAQSGGVMVARSPEDMRKMLVRGLTEPKADSASRQQFIQKTFGPTLDGHCGRRVADVLTSLASGRFGRNANGGCV